MPANPDVDPTTIVEHWGATGRWAILGGPTFYAEWDGPDDEIPIVLVHGLGGSHLNWVLLAEKLAEHRRVYAIDLAGFGLTHPAGRRTTVTANSQLVARFLEKVVGRPAYLAGNSMGGLISIVTTYDRSDLVAGLILVNAAVPLPVQMPDRQAAKVFMQYFTPRLGERALRRKRERSPQQQVADMMGLCTAKPQELDHDFIDAHVAMAAHRQDYTHSDESFLEAVRSTLHRRNRLGPVKRRMGAIRCPVLMLHGELDRLITVESARRAHRWFPYWTYIEYRGVGHLAMSEVPQMTADHIHAWIAEIEQDDESDERTA